LRPRPTFSQCCKCLSSIASLHSSTLYEAVYLRLYEGSLHTSVAAICKAGWPDEFAKNAQNVAQLIVCQGNFNRGKRGPKIVAASVFQKLHKLTVARPAKIRRIWSPCSSPKTSFGWSCTFIHTCVHRRF
jgi:hypothetical protein